MRFTQNIAAASALLTIASASPIVDKRQKANKDFVIKQSVAKPDIKSGPAALASAYAKYGKSAPAQVRAAAAANDGTVATSPTQYDSEYLTPVTIGGQQLTLDFDTGSSDLWVFSSETPANEVNGHNTYDPSQSSTSKELQGYTWNITYGDQSSSSGTVYTDTVTVGETTFANQAVEIAEQVSNQFTQDAGNDGLLGLAFSSINTVKPQQQLTFFDNVKSSLSAPLFTADLKKGQPGTYGFGSIDDSAHTGTITYVDVDSSQGFWAFNADGYSVNGNSGGAINGAIADTGTSLLLVDDSIVSDYYSGVRGAQNDQSQGGYTYPCSATLPDITFTIGGYDAVVPGSYINYAPTQAAGTTCFGGLQSNSGIGFSIFGDIFLKSQFVVFNGDGPQLGLAPKPLVSGSCATPRPRGFRLSRSNTSWTVHASAFQSHETTNTNDFPLRSHLRRSLKHDIHEAQAAQPQSLLELYLIDDCPCLVSAVPYKVSQPCSLVVRNSSSRVDLPSQLLHPLHITRAKASSHLRGTSLCFPLPTQEPHDAVRPPANPMPDSPLDANWGPQHSSSQHCNRACTVLVATLVPLAALVTIAAVVYLLKTRPDMRGAHSPTLQQRQAADEVELERRKIGDWESLGSVSRTKLHDLGSERVESQSRERGIPWAERDAELGVKVPETPVIKVRNWEAEEEVESRHGPV